MAVSDTQQRTICVITGATSGIGRRAALALAVPGASFVLAGRNARAGEETAQRIRTTGASCESVRADLSQPSNIHALADAIRAAHTRVDVLINNAGARNDTYADSGFGTELTFAVNHLGHFLLTGLLMDRLERSRAARVITVASGAHAAVDAGEPWHLPRAQFDRRIAYSKSKLANVMFAYELARRTAGTPITSNSVDPGGVATGFARNNGLGAWVRHLVAHATKRDLVSPRRGAETIVYLARSGEVAGVSGKHFRHCRPVASSPSSYDVDAARRLWELSARLTGLRERAMTAAR